MRVYLDHNATSPLRPAVKAAMLAALDSHGNAASVHAEGRKQFHALDGARSTLAWTLGVNAEGVIFTSGGTEANNLALRGTQAEYLLVSAIEHPSVLEAAKSSSKVADIVPVDGNGLVRLDALKAKLGRRNTLVSIMLANNETGVIQPLNEIVDMVHEAGALLHVDAVQAVGKMAREMAGPSHSDHINFALLKCDMMSVSAHKIGGPVGAGALLVRDRIELSPLLAGGGQESRRRSGTENISAIVGFAEVMKSPALYPYRPVWRDMLETALPPEAVVFSKDAPRLGNTTCFAIPGMSAETLLMALDLEGFAVSSGSACASGKVGRSHVLSAMGVPKELAACAIRVSQGWTTKRDEISAFNAALTRLHEKHKLRNAGQRQNHG
ncbi:MAG: cysteine desulfurase family protein [Hyphomicrobiales bacterium]